ncbi:PREDICTED: uncharacterized protein LOC108749007 [Trachymyrmex septentrionalis]|uniref:uncharacterized protein LOC108749007 n=1 Tax=Trachymyrmex septentrionalis TaxID=34720 RepID=UPI00084EF891|nr:PREDICTED: uncharacterized protein LOC108749007 [Trachymyrmex septentrionalis]
MKLSKYIHLTYSQENLIDFLVEHHLLVATMNCDNCKEIIDLNEETLLFVCKKKTITEKENNKKSLNAICNFKRSATKGTWFDRLDTDLQIICRLTAYFVMVPRTRQKFLRYETGLSVPTINEWIKYCREVCVYWAKKRSQKLGGPGMTVEIDGAKIGRRKGCDVTKKIKGDWIYGGFERETRRIFIVPVEVGTKESLLKTIKEWINPGTSIVTYFWKTYNCVNDKSFKSLKRKHSYKFIDPKADKIADDTHIREIESCWREVRAHMPRPASYSLQCFSEYLFKRVNELDVRIETFFDIIAEMYPPKR